MFVFIINSHLMISGLGNRKIRKKEIFRREDSVLSQNMFIKIYKLLYCLSVFHIMHNLNSILFNFKYNMYIIVY